MGRTTRRPLKSGPHVARGQPPRPSFLFGSPPFPPPPLVSPCSLGSSHGPCPSHRISPYRS
eukprot:3241865-Lingulodinium_polyedra.AAC.1